VTSIERTAYPRFERLITAHELNLFFAPTREEAAWAAERMDSDGHQLALLLALKSYQRMGRFPKPDEYPEMVVDFVRRAVELPEGTVPLWATGRTAERQRTEVRCRVGATYDQAEARRIAEASIRKEAAAKNQPPGRPDQHRAGEGRRGRAGAAGVLHPGRDGLDGPQRGELVDLHGHPRPDERGGAGGAAAAAGGARG
jgi:hypothetical protein